MIIAIFLILIGMLIIASIQDIKDKEISIIIFPIAFLSCLALNIIYIIQTKESPIPLLIGGIGYGLFTLILALIKKIGWGDFFMIAIIGGSLGWVRATEILIIACVAAVIYVIYRKIKNKPVKIQYPFAPFLLIGTIIDFIFFLCI